MKSHEMLSFAVVIPYPFVVMYAMGATPPSPEKGPESMATSSHAQLSVFFFLGCIAIVIALLLLIILFRKMRSPTKEIKFITQSGSNQASADILSGNLHTTSYINYNTLKKATKNFHQDFLLGRGGFGPVYQGKLEDGRMVAIKKLSLEKSQQGESEFLAEVRLITSIQHKNLLRLIGCCSDGPQRLLVYEFMKNQSLDRIIYGKNNVFLDWNSRFQIIKGTARGLQYLHEDSNVRIVHRDIKASNILLDEKFQPKIGDFGLARFFPEDQAYLSTGFAGTLNGSLTLIEEKRPLFRGYTAPEYAIRGELSEKADLYSFGVLMLEIISSRRNTDLTLPSEMQYLPEYPKDRNEKKDTNAALMETLHKIKLYTSNFNADAHILGAWKLYERKKLGDLVDPRLKEEGSSVENDILHAIHVAFLCLQPHANLRPPMSEIFAMLTRNAKTVQTPIKPIFLDRRHKMSENNSFDVSEV